MASSAEWGDDAAGGEWTTATRSGRSSHAGAAGCSPNAKRAAPRPPKPAAPTVGEVGEGLAGLDLEGASRTGRLDKYDISMGVSGDGVPAPADGFEESGLAEAVLQNVARYRYYSPTPVQRYSIPIVLSGRDLMACSQTGSGKTAAFCLPVVSRLAAAADAERGPGGEGGRGDRDAYHCNYHRLARPLALVLAPTRERASKINEEAKKFAHKTGLKVKGAYGGTSVIQQLRNIAEGVDILVATPGRLVDMIERGTISLESIEYLIMDEADRMLDMGLEPQIRKIVDGMGMPRKSVRQTIMFSATFPPEIQRLASDFLSKYILITVGREGSSTDLITQQVEFVTHDEKRTHLIDLLQKQSFISSDGKPQQPLTLVFVETPLQAHSLCYWLYNKGLPATVIHGDQTQKERESALRSFKSGSTPIVVTTDVVARGLDVPNVAHVINYDLPKSIGDYVHRIGRTGRAGNPGSATVFTESNRPIAKELLELMTKAKQNVPTWLEGTTQGSHSMEGQALAEESEGPMAMVAAALAAKIVTAAATILATLAVGAVAGATLVLVVTATPAVLTATPVATATLVVAVTATPVVVAATSVAVVVTATPAAAVIGATLVVTATSAAVARATLVVVVADTPVAEATTLPTPWARRTSSPLAGTSRVAPSPQVACGTPDLSSVPARPFFVV